MNRKLIIYSSIAIALMIAAVLIFRDKGGKEMESSPEAVVEAFTKAISSGDFEKAYDLCDTTAMKGYLENWIRIREQMQKRDSNALAIASSILSEAAITIEGSEKTDGGRKIYYRVEAEGISKQKAAVVKKEEGEWRVEAVTDAI